MMAKNIKNLATRLGATKVASVPDVGGGAFGMARLARIMADRLEPSQGKRPGRPTDPSWSHYGKVPMSESTMAQLAELAESVSTSERKISPMQLAAQLLEEGLASYARAR